MLRDILNKNINGLNDTEKQAVRYVTGYPIDWFTDKKNKDKDVLNVLENGFSKYFKYEDYKPMHPFEMIWDKIVEGAHVCDLIRLPKEGEEDYVLYDEEYKNVAQKVNYLYKTKYHDDVLIYLEAIGKKYKITQADGESMEVHASNIAANMDTEDLLGVLLFCRRLEIESYDYKFVNSAEEE